MEIYNSNIKDRFITESEWKNYLQKYFSEKELIRFSDKDFPNNFDSILSAGNNSNINAISKLKESIENLKKSNSK